MDLKKKTWKLNLITLPSDGLKQHWEGFVWCNPPYGRNIFPWIAKMANHGNGILLVFSRTDVDWFHKAILLSSDHFFIKGRLSFLNDNFETKNNAGCGNTLFCFGREAVQRCIRAKNSGKLAII